MNNQDRDDFRRLEVKIDEKFKITDSKIDVINERGIRTEDKVTAHLQHHDNRVKYGIGILGIVVTIIIAGFKYLKEFIVGLWD